MSSPIFVHTDEEMQATTLDLIDGGISVILRCPGHPTAPVSLENLTVDIYVTPRELTEGGKQISERVALLVQEFGANIALPHLHRFQKLCSMEGIKPLPAPGTSDNLSGTA